MAGMVISTRVRLILSFLGVSALGGTLSLAVGSRLIYRAVLREALSRVAQDLNVAREIYSSRQQRIATGLLVTGLDQGIQTALISQDGDTLRERTREIAAQLQLDFAGFVRPDGSLICRLGSGDGQVLEERESRVSNLAVTRCLATRSAVAGSVVLEDTALSEESPELARLARIDMVPTRMAAPSAKTVETRGLTITAASPVFSRGRFAGAVYGGILLNRNADIVDKVRDTVFQGETLGGRPIGTATIFLYDLRVATNVISESGERAIGTRVSREVKERVLDGGGAWTNRAFVVNDWYVSAYQPIVDVADAIVGILYTGVLEEKFVAVQRETVAVFVLITVGGVIVSVALGAFLGDRLLRPIRELIGLSTRVSQGDLTMILPRTPCSSARPQISELTSDCKPRPTSAHAAAQVILEWRS